ncbi:MAG: DUF4364 family protein [Clostridiales bacterium]|nr:DUF4364 family protein [Clostridiales bacterium]MCD7827170.1 DUF4364 family protein [Clostridiales bacterium]
MDFNLDAFPVDDTKNGIRSTEKIKIIICYIMSAVQTPLSRSTIQSILYDNGIANYFEISQAVDDLLAVNALEPKKSENSDEEELYSLNENGERIARELENELSVYIKNKAVKAANLTLLYEKRQRENDISVEKLGDKRYRLNITMHSGLNSEVNNDELLKLELFVTDELRANSMKRCFINNPVKLYEKITEALTEDAEFR